MSWCGNTLMLCVASVKASEISEYELKDDYYLKVDPDGNPIWKWHVAEHFDEFTYSDEARPLMSETPGVHIALGLGDYQHANTAEILPPNELEASDSRFTAGNILGCERNANTIFVIDKKSGKVIRVYIHDTKRFYHHKFYSFSWGSIRRLPNGNTFSLDSNRGRIFEIMSALYSLRGRGLNSQTYGNGLISPSSSTLVPIFIVTLQIR